MPLVKTLETNTVFYPYFILIEKKESFCGDFGLDQLCLVCAW